MRTIIGLALASLVGLASSASTTTTSKPHCPPWGCGANGTQTTGIADGSAPQIETVTLPSGEIVQQ